MSFNRVSLMLGLATLGSAQSVYLQFPTIPGLPGMPPFTPPDQMINGIPVDGSAGGPTFALGDGNYVDNIPPYLRETEFFGIQSIQNGGGLKFDCPDKPVPTPCEFYVAVLACPACGTLVNGGLPQLLTVTTGYESRSCGPKFHVKDDDTPYKMTIFRVAVPSGYYVETPKVGNQGANYVAVFASLEDTGYCAPSKPMGPFPAGGCTTCPVSFEV